VKREKKGCLVERDVKRKDRKSATGKINGGGKHVEEHKEPERWEQLGGVYR